MEFLHGRPLSPEEMEIIRRQIEEGFEVIGAVDDEVASSPATGRTCFPSFRRKKTEAVRRLSRYCQSHYGTYDAQQTNWFTSWF
jgi:hypothetical protein